MTSCLYDSLEFFLIVYRDLRVSDFQNLSDNFFAFLDELNENSDLGLVSKRIFRVPHGISIQRIERAAAIGRSAKSDAFSELLQLESRTGETISVSRA